MIAVDGMAEFSFHPNEATHEALIESYLERHPWSTIGQVRDGIEAEGGPRIERVQGRLQSIKRRREVHSRPLCEGSVVLEYRLGAPRTKPRQKILGLEISWWDDTGIEDRVHRSDVEDERVRAVVDEVLARAVAEIRRGFNDLKERREQARRAPPPSRPTPAPPAVQKGGYGGGFGGGGFGGGTAKDDEDIPF